MSQSNTWRHVSKESPCMICGRPDWCSRSNDGKVSLCRRLDTGNGISRTDRNGDEYWLYFDEDATDLDQSGQYRVTDGDNRNRSCPEALSKVYSAMLDELTLSTRHKANLSRRGLSNDVIEKFGYKSMPPMARTAIARRLADRFGEESLLKVPGFHSVEEHGKKWLTISGAVGICIPVRNVAGQIIAIKIRADDGSGGPRYSYLSSTKYGGPGPGAQVHLPLFSGDSSRLRITEGELKADIATALSEVLTIGMPGISQSRPAVEVASQLQAHSISMAFDFDARRNPNVAKALQNTANRIADQGFELELEVWPEEAGKGIDDALASGFVPENISGKGLWQELASIVVAAESSGQSRQISTLSSNSVVTIQVNERFLRDITNDCIAAIHMINQDNPQVYVRGNTLARLLHSNEGVVSEALDRNSLKGVLDRSANFVTRGEAKGQIIEVPSRPPDDVVADLLSLPSYNFPELNSIAGAPVLRPNSRFLLAQGYDRGSGIYLHLNGLNSRISSDWPVEKCLDIIFNDLLVDFPLSDKGSQAHVLALMLLPFIRPYIDGPAPLHLLDAPSRGTGKGLLADVIAIIALGTPAWVMPLSRDENEVRKSVTSVLMAGSPMILLDNVHKLDSSNLCAVLTTTRWRDRLLGRSRMVEVPNRSTWIATGNNVTLSDEMARRTVHIRMDAKVERPEERRNFRHKDLLRWTVEHRYDLVSYPPASPWSITGLLGDAREAMQRWDGSKAGQEHWAAYLKPRVLADFCPTGKTFMPRLISNRWSGHHSAAPGTRPMESSR